MCGVYFIREYFPPGGEPSEEERREPADFEPSQPPQRSGTLTSLEEFVRRGLRPRPEGDLLERLPAGSEDAVAVAAALEVWRALDRDGSRIKLIDCELSEKPGTLECAFGITGIDATVSAEVVPGDPVHPGFVLLRPREGPIAVVPRIWRRVCSNGAVRAVADGADLAGGTRDIGKAMAGCFDRRRFESTVAAYRRLAAHETDDPERLLHEADVAAVSLAGVLHRFRTGEDRSVWGLLNAVTVTAKVSATWEERIERELSAARLMERFAGTPALDSE